jgi:hypothetical protein
VVGADGIGTSQRGGCGPGSPGSCVTRGQSPIRLDVVRGASGGPWNVRAPEHVRRQCRYVLRTSRV